MHSGWRGQAALLLHSVHHVRERELHCGRQQIIGRGLRDRQVLGQPPVDDEDPVGGRGFPHAKAEAIASEVVVQAGHLTKQQPIHETQHTGAFPPESRSRVQMEAIVSRKSLARRTIAGCGARSLRAPQTAVAVVSIGGAGFMNAATGFSRRFAGALGVTVRRARLARDAIDVDGRKCNTGIILKVIPP